MASFNMKTAAAQLARAVGQLSALSRCWPKSRASVGHCGEQVAMQITLLTGRQISDQPRQQQSLGSEGRAGGRDTGQGTVCD